MVLWNALSNVTTENYAIKPIIYYVVMTRQKIIGLYHDNFDELYFWHFVPAKMTVIITVTSWWARWRLKSPALQFYTQPFIQAQIKKNTKAPHHWPLCWEFTGDRRIPRTKDQ